MNKKISVLILADNQEYVQRCKTSINNQTYPEIEIWQINHTSASYTLESDGFSKISEDSFSDMIKTFLTHSDSQRIFFIQSSQVLAPDCMQKLARSDNGICSASVLHNCNNTLSPSKEDKLFLSGKLIPREALVKLSLKIDDLFVEDQVRFLLEILTLGYDYTAVEDAHIYTFDHPEEISLSPEFLSAIADKYKNDILKLDQMCLLDYCSLSGLTDLDKIEFAAQMYPCIKGNPAAVISASYSYIAPVLQKEKLVLIDKREFDALKNFFNLFSEDTNKSLIYTVLGCTETIGLLFNVLDYTGFQQCIPLLKNEFNQEHILSENVCRTVDSLEKKLAGQIDQLHAALANLSVTNTTSKSVDDIFGLELVDYTVNCYMTGKLGFKTLLKSFKAWIKCKL